MYNVMRALIITSLFILVSNKYFLEKKSQQGLENIKGTIDL